MWKKYIIIFPDSIIAEQTAEAPLFKTGDNLGELCCEVEKISTNGVLREFCSLGAKNYCLRVTTEGEDDKFVRKLKGVGLKYNNKRETSMEVMKQILHGDLDSVTIRLMKHIEKDNDFNIFTREESSKKMSLVFDKRQRVGAYGTQPWGYRDDKEEVVPDPNIIIPEWAIRKHLSTEWVCFWYFCIQ